MIETIKELLSHPPFEAFTFWLCTLATVAAALTAAFSSSIIRASYSLFFALFAFLGYYILLGADFMGIVQVVVYVGGILALILFGVLLTNRGLTQLVTETQGMRTAGVIASLALFLILFVSILTANWAAVSVDPLPEIGPTTETLGRVLLSKYLLPFEFISVTLLVALLGASYLVRRSDD